MISYIAPSTQAMVNGARVLEHALTTHSISLSSLGELGWNMTIGPMALRWSMSQVEQMLPAESDEDRATPYAVTLAGQFLDQVGCESPLLISATTAESFEGDLILHWEIGNRSLALVFPSWAGRPIKLYRETLEGKRAVESRLDADPAPARVAQAIEWLTTQ